MFEGTPSTKSLASLSPKPVNSFTALTTANLEAPASFNTTVNSDFSSATSPAPAPPETTTAAAAGSIPYSSFNIVANSLTSLTVKLTNCSANCFKSAIFLSFNDFLFIVYCARFLNYSASAPSN